MVDKKTAEEARLDLAFSALADPTRRKIIDLLREAEELKVTEIAQAFSMSLNGVSKHLKCLERAGLIHREIEGRVHRIRVDWHGLRRPYEFLGHYHQYWSRRLEALADALTTKEGETDE
ncbi:MAG: helix-turn-helix transcriptional regulator [Gemmatimonadetes bacterium]|nr:helix-turn-helix transcriptional regulator [Gemmatimonadota bacterium]MBT6144396.1 helix-turn-helix transcriptional regulator [Gemmatimonadota bacterium]MBT7863363.1 helix-turn-helix transcriptional regulator [Gemmatimonadota bacterium]